MTQKKHQIDEIDLDIIEALMVDPNLSCRKIAEQIGGTTERTVRYRIKTLYENQVIYSYVAPNHDALGLSTIADVFLSIEPGRVLEIAKELTNYSCISYVSCSTGNNDISLQIVAKDNVDLYEFANEELAKIPGVKNLNIAIVPIILKVAQWSVKDIVKDGARGNIRRLKIEKQPIIDDQKETFMT